jgi:hypothetical protein
MAKKIGKKDEGVAIPKPEIKIVELSIIGDSSMLCHRFSEKSKKQIEDKQQQEAKTAKGKRDPKAEFEASLYPLSKGKYGFPASAFKKAMVGACTFVDGMTKVTARGALFVMGDLIELKGAKPTMHTSFVRLARGGSADIRYRAEFKEWSCKLQIRYNAKVVSTEQIMNLLANAGFSIGVGDWRPEKDGTHGMFHVKGAQ